MEFDKNGSLACNFHITKHCLSNYTISPPSVIKVCMEKNKVRLEMLRMEFSTEIVLLQTVQHVSIRSTSALR